jgi:hypothetical protein
MRGLHRSAPRRGTRARGRELEARGVRELNIISQDTTWYGRDLRRGRRRRGRGGRRGDPLLADLSGAPRGTEIPWYRLFYMYPSGITPELVELLASRARGCSPIWTCRSSTGATDAQADAAPERQATIRERVEWLRAAIPDSCCGPRSSWGSRARRTRSSGDAGPARGDPLRAGGRVSPTRSRRARRRPNWRGNLSESEKRDRLEDLMDLQREISFERTRR